MEYREQLKKKRKKKISKADKILWKMLFFVSAMCFCSMAYLGVFSSNYMAIALVIMLLNLLIVKVIQKRACISKKKRKKGRGLIFISCAIMLFLSFYMVKLAVAMDEISTGEEIGGYEEEHEIDVTEQSFNVYISGIDVYGEVTQESRSDVNLIVTVNPNEHKILITTTPRDYYVTIPGVSGEEKDKLTHAGIYGIDTSIATLENLYKTDIPFYARVNFTSVIDMVDALGGVDVESEIAFTTGVESGAVVEIKEGTNHLNGGEALAFVRERKAFVDGDNQRGKNQQALLTALIKEILSPMILFQANDMIDSFVGNAETNMSEEQMKSLIRMQLDDMQGWEIESIAATGDDSGKRYCYSHKGEPLYVTVPHQSSVEEITDKISKVSGY